MKTLYLCRECALLLGDNPEQGGEVENGACLNCESEGPHIPGQFTDEDATRLLNIGNPEPTI